MQIPKVYKFCDSIKVILGINNNQKFSIIVAWTLNQVALTDARHHRHWQRVLSQVAGLQLGSLKFALPANGTVLGGTMELHGSNISLACFHGINFKSKSWALFSLKEPCISFATEAQEIPSVECKYSIVL